MQAALEAANVAARFATGDDLIMAVTMRGHQKACLKDYKVRFTLLTGSVQGSNACLLSSTRRSSGESSNLFF